MLSESQRLEEAERLANRVIHVEKRDFAPDERARYVELMLGPQPTTEATRDADDHPS